MKNIITITLSLFVLAITASFALAGGLVEAIDNDNSQEAIRMINQGANVEDANKAGTTAIIRAAELGMADVVKALIAAKADVNAKSNPGYTALMLAADNGKTEIVRILLDAGADVTAKSGAGMTALDMAKAASHHEISQMLRQAGGN